MIWIGVILIRKPRNPILIQAPTLPGTGPGASLRSSILASQREGSVAEDPCPAGPVVRFGLGFRV